MNPVDATPRDLRESTTLLVGGNVVSAAIGAAQGLVVLRILGTDLFGAAAVLVALTAVAANLVDVRLADWISKLYFDDRAACAATGAAYRRRALRLGLVLYAAGGAVIALVGAALTWLLVSRLTNAEVSAWTLAVAAAAQGVTYLGSFFIYVQRLAFSARRMAVLQIASGTLNAAAMVGSVAVSATIGGYAAGLAASACAIALLNGWQSLTVLRRRGLALLEPIGDDAPPIDYREMLRFVAAGNVLGYVKLLHRAADVVLVAAFCGDRETGIYRLARTMADALYTISEAVGRVYQPRLLTLLQQNRVTEYRAIARSLTGSVGALTVAAAIAAMALLPAAAPWFGVADGFTLAVCVSVLTLAFFFAAGLQSWLWPVYVFEGRLGRCTLWGVTGVLAGQYFVGPALTYLTGRVTPVWFAIGFVSYYLLAVLPLWRELPLGNPARSGAVEAPAA